MANSAGRVIAIGVPPRHDGTSEPIQELNSLLALNKCFGYKFIRVACSISNKSVLGRDKFHIEDEVKTKLRRVIQKKINC